jgi:hypothetical protein
MICKAALAIFVLLSLWVIYELIVAPTVDESWWIDEY